MRKLLVVGCLMVSSAAWADMEVKNVAPGEGRDAVKAMKPDWCPAGYPAKTDQDENSVERTVWSLAERMPNGLALGSSLDTIAQVGCDYPKSPYAQGWVAAWRQSWINASGMGDKEDREHLGAFVDGKAADKALNDWCDGQRKSWKGAELTEFNSIWAVNDMLCGENPFPDHKPYTWAMAYWLDNPVQPAREAVRLAHVYMCISSIRWGSDYENPTKEAAAEGYAFCGWDARQLDKAKLMSELDALKAPPIVRARLVQIFTFTRLKAAQARKVIEDVASSDSKYKELYLDGADKATAEWQKLYEANKDLLDAAFAIDAKVAANAQGKLYSEAVPIGCDPVRKAYQDYVKKKNPRTPADVIDASTDPVGYPILLRLALCDGIEGRGTDASAEISMLLMGHRIWNGPRMYAAASVFERSRNKNWGGPMSIGDKLYDSVYQTRDPLRRIAEVIRDRTAGELGSVVDAAASAGSITAEVSRAGDMFKGRVQSVKKTADGVAVVFKHEQWDEPRYDCVITGIAMYQSDGTPVHSHSCKFSHMEHMDFKAEPVVLQGFTADMAKPGVLLKYLPLKQGFGFAVVVQQSAGKKEPKTTGYFGFTLK